MRHVLAAAFLMASIPAWADQPLTFAARDNGFVVSSTATASVNKAGPFLVVALQRHVLRASKDYKIRPKVLEYRVGLARNNAQGRWNIERWSDFVHLGFTLKPGDTKQLSASTLLIPVDNVSSFQEAWLVLEVKVLSGETAGTTYAHTEKLALD